MAAQHWSSCEEILHAQGQKRSSSKMVGGVNSCLESNPIPARDVQRAQTNLVCTRTQGPHRDRDRTVEVWVSLLQGQGFWVQQIWYGISPLGRGHY